MTLTKPRNNKQKILRALILRNSVSERMFSQNGFRARLTTIRRVLAEHGIRLRSAKKSFTNEFGRKDEYNVYFLTNIDKRRVMKAYRELSAD